MFGDIVTPGRGLGFNVTVEPQKNLPRGQSRSFATITGRIEDIPCLLGRNRVR
jgi:hypothetical protein